VGWWWLYYCCYHVTLLILLLYDFHHGVDLLIILGCMMFRYDLFCSRLICSNHSCPHYLIWFVLPLFMVAVLLIKLRFRGVVGQMIAGYRCCYTYVVVVTPWFGIDLITLFFARLFTALLHSPFTVLLGMRWLLFADCVRYWFYLGWCSAITLPITICQLCGRAYRGTIAILRYLPFYCSGTCGATFPTAADWENIVHLFNHVYFASPVFGSLRWFVTVITTDLVICCYFVAIVGMFRALILFTVMMILRCCYCYVPAMPIRCWYTFCGMIFLVRWRSVRLRWPVTVVDCYVWLRCFGRVWFTVILRAVCLLVVLLHWLPCDPLFHATLFCGAGVHHDTWCGVPFTFSVVSVPLLFWCIHTFCYCGTFVGYAD